MAWVGWNPSLTPVLVTIGCPIGVFIHSFLFFHCVLLINLLRVRSAGATALTNAIANSAGLP